MPVIKTNYKMRKQDIGDLVISTSAIAYSCIQGSMILPGEVGQTHLANKLLQATHFQDNIVSTSALAASAIQASHLTNKLLQATHFPDAVVSTSALAASAIQASHLTNKLLQATHFPDGVVSTSALAASAIQESHITSWAVIPAKLRLDAANSQTVMQSIGFLLSAVDVCDAEGLLTVSTEDLGRPLWVQAAVVSVPGTAVLASCLMNILPPYLTMNSALEGPISGSIAYLKFMGLFNDMYYSDSAVLVRTASFASMALATVRCVYWGLIGSR